MLRKIKILLILAVTFAITEAKAQQIPFYNHYYINPFIYNPSYAGTNNLWNAYLVHHAQWAGFPGAPVTNAITVDGPIKSKKVGVGLNLLSDVTGITNKIGLNTSYSYRADINRDHQLYFGLSLGVVNNQINFSKQNLVDEDEADISMSDESNTSFDASFGLNYNWNNLNIGFCVPQILNKSSSNINDQNPRGNALSKNYLTSIKYTFTLNSDKGITAYPMVMLRTYPGAPVQYDINAVLDWQKHGWFAVSYKNDYAVTLNLGIRYNSLSFGYAYDLIINPIGDYAGTSSEFLVGFSFGAPKKKQPGYLEVREISSDPSINESKKTDSVQSDLIERIEKIENFNKGMSVSDVAVGQLYRLNSINFSMKSTTLDSKSKQILDELVEFLSENSTIKMEVHGHTDDVGEPDNNMALSEKRAKMIYDYLLEKGVDESRIDYKFFGESHPVMKGTSAKVRALNRRTEILILEK